MKKRILTILACVLMLINVFTFSACGNSELEAKIAELEAKIESLEDNIKSYTQGKIMSLEIAYNLGLLTKDDLISIAYYNNGRSNRGNKEIMPEDFEPQPKNPEVLSEELDLKIREVCAKNNQNNVDDYYIDGYYGIYNHCVIIQMDARGVMHPQVILTMKVDDVTFYFTGPWLSVYCMEELPQVDYDILSYYHQPSIEEDYKDDEVNVILKSAYKGKKEISFADFKNISNIATIKNSKGEINNTDSKVLALRDDENHIVTLTLKNKGKQEVLNAINELSKLDMVLVAEPSYIYEIKH